MPERILREQQTTNGWTCWWWPVGFDYEHDLPVPASRTFDDLDTAIEHGQRMRDAGASWAKVFVTGNEAREAWHSSERRDA